MINLQQARDAIAAVATEAIGDHATAYPLPPVGTINLPAVVVGMPDWTPSEHDLGQCLDKVTIPVGLVVARPGTDDAATVTQLEQLWPVLLDAINTEMTEGTAFDHVCALANVTNADFGLFQIGGQAYPAQTIFIDFYG